MGNTILVSILAFGIIAVSSDKLSQWFTKLKFPLITGMLAIGIITGPYVLGMISLESIRQISFLNDISLSFIAFAAGTELYLKELRSSVKSIAWNTIAQITAIFLIGTFGVYYLSDYIPFAKDLSSNGKIAIALLASTIFIASSPSSVIAVINEMRSRGPLTKMSIGVTMVKDVIIIIIFAIVFSLANTLVSNEPFELIIILEIAIELALAFGIGFGLGKILEYFLNFWSTQQIKIITVITLGYLAYPISHIIRHYSVEFLPFDLHAEPLLIAIMASFYITNYTRHRLEFIDIIHKISPYIYVVFFTLTGISLSIDTLLEVWQIALVFFLIRILGLIIGAFSGAILAKDPPQFKFLGWMPFITQAGVGVGLAMLVANDFPEWGGQFATLIIASIVLTQVIGPPLFKFAILKVKEEHRKGSHKHKDKIKNAVIFGMENQSVALAKLLNKHHWKVDIASCKTENLHTTYENINILQWDSLDLNYINSIDMENVDAVILMLTDRENYSICEMIYENYGIETVVVRLQSHRNYDKFASLGALIVEPTTSMVSLLDHYVRSPIATSILLGEDDNKDTMDVVLEDPTFFDVYLRDLKLPAEILVLSIRRGGETIITHGYTQLKKGDILTLFGPLNELEKVDLKLGSN